MKTYNDLAKLETEQERQNFILAAISEHKSSKGYKKARDAELYYRHENPTIMRAQKFLYDYAGRAKPDIYAANNKVPSRYYFYFVTQLVQFLLGNGVSFAGEDTKETLGGPLFDIAIQDIATEAQNGGAAFGFWNLDHLETFGLAGIEEPSFVPLWDEYTGMLRAGIRFWQIDANKPMRCTLYEEDGYTEYVQDKTKPQSVTLEIVQEKREYYKQPELSRFPNHTIL